MMLLSALFRAFHFFKHQWQLRAQLPNEQAYSFYAHCIRESPRPEWKQAWLTYRDANMPKYFHKARISRTSKAPTYPLIPRKASHLEHSPKLNFMLMQLAQWLPASTTMVYDTRTHLPAVALSLPATVPCVISLEKNKEQALLTQKQLTAREFDKVLGLPAATPSDFEQQLHRFQPQLVVLGRSYAPQELTWQLEKLSAASSVQAILLLACYQRRPATKVWRQWLAHNDQYLGIDLYSCMLFLKQPAPQQNPIFSFSLNGC